MEVKLLKQALVAIQWQTHTSYNYILLTAVLEKLVLEHLLVFLHSLFSQLLRAKALNMSWISLSP